MPKSKGRTNHYEAMFLISQAAEPSLAKAIEHVNHLLGRADAEVIALSKWDERRLAFEIEKQKRGLYLLVYFTADPVNIVGLERDTNLSETIMRFMVLRADHLTEDEMRATDGRQELETEMKMREETPSTPGPAPESPTPSPEASPAPAAPAPEENAPAPEENEPAPSTSG